MNIRRIPPIALAFAALVAVGVPTAQADDDGNRRRGNGGRDRGPRIERSRERPSTARSSWSNPRPDWGRRRDDSPKPQLQSTPRVRAAQPRFDPPVRAAQGPGFDGSSNAASLWGRRNGSGSSGSTRSSDAGTPFSGRRSDALPGRSSLGSNGDSLARYRAAIQQARERARLGDADRRGSDAVRSGTGNDSLLERFRRRTPASSDAPTLNAPPGTTATRRTDVRSASGGSDTPFSSRQRSTFERNGSLSERFRQRRERGGDGVRSGSSSPSGASSSFFGAGSATARSHASGSSRDVRRRSSSHSYHDGHHHDGHHRHRGHVHRHHGGGFYVSWWNPWHYRTYGSFWLGGLPAFGFGLSYYDPYYAPYFGPDVVVVEQPVPVYADPGPAYGPVYPPSVGPAPAAPLVGPGPTVPAPMGSAPGASDPAAPAPTDDGAGLPSADEGDAAKQAFDTGLRAFGEQRYEQAFGMFRLVTDLDPENGEGWLGRAHAAFALAQYRDAAEAVARAADLGAFPRGYRFDPRPVYRAPGAFDAALERLRAYARTNPQDADAHLLVAWLQVGLGDKEAAKASLDALKGLRADDPTAAFLRVAMLPPEAPAATGEPVRPPAPGAAPQVPLLPENELPTPR